MDKISISEDVKTKVANYVRKQIFYTNKYQNGDRINERQIARELNTSRAPVREALKELEEQGIITSVRYTGWFVTDFNEKELNEISKVRTQLELNIFESLVKEKILTDEDFLFLKNLNNQMKELSSLCESWERNCKLADKDMEFHMYLLGHSNMKWTKKILTNLFYQIRLCLVNNLFEKDHIYRCVERHDRMISCLREGDLDCLKQVLSLRFSKGV